MTLNQATQAQMKVNPMKIPIHHLMRLPSKNFHHTCKYLMEAHLKCPNN